MSAITLTPEQIARLHQRLAAANQRADHAENLLYRLTPGGDEFEDNPDRCFNWIRQHESEVTRDMLDHAGVSRALSTRLADIEAERAARRKAEMQAFDHGTAVAALERENADLGQRLAAAEAERDDLRERCGRQMDIVLSQYEQVDAAEAELSVLRAIVNSDCPMGGPDLFKSLHIEKLHMMDEIAELRSQIAVMEAALIAARSLLRGERQHEFDLTIYGPEGQNVVRIRKTIEQIDRALEQPDTDATPGQPA